MSQVLSRWEAFLSQVKPSKGPVRSYFISIWLSVLADICLKGFKQLNLFRAFSNNNVNNTHIIIYNVTLHGMSF